MSPDETSKSSIKLYLAEGGCTGIECRFENKTIWLTQALIAELFEVTPQNVTLYLKRSMMKARRISRQLVRITYKFDPKAAGRFRGK